MGRYLDQQRHYMAPKKEERFQKRVEVLEKLIKIESREGRKRGLMTELKYLKMKVAEGKKAEAQGQQNEAVAAT